MTQGKCVFVDPTNGSDANSGTSADSAFKTLTAGEDALVANQNDVLYYMAGSTAINLSATLTWDKAYTHLVGISAPTAFANRARIFHNANFSPVVNVTASGCSFRNFYISTGRGDAGNLIGWQDTGARNYYEGVHFHGIANDTEGDQATASCLKLDGAADTTFRNCVIGTYSANRSTTNAELLLDSNAGPLLFEDCTFIACTDNAGHVFVKLFDTTSACKGIMFKRCVFDNYSNNDTIAMTSAFSIPASHQTVHILLQQCTSIKVADWDASDRAKLWIDGASPTANASGLALNTTA
jgi:hypothetical protein